MGVGQYLLAGTYAWLVLKAVTFSQWVGRVQQLSMVRGHLADVARVA